MHSGLAVIALVAAVSAACGRSSESDDVANERGRADAASTEYCGILMSPPPTDVFRDPTNAAARDEFEDWLSKLDATAPAEQRPTLDIYARAARSHLDTMATGNRPSEVTAEAFNASAERLNEYVDAACF